MSTENIQEVVQEKKKWTRTKPQYKVRYLDCDEQNPQWHDHECVSYAEMSKLFKDKYGLRFTRDQLQNFALDRNNARHFFPNVKITKIK